MLKNFPIKQMNQSLFRRQHFWNEKVDNVIKAFKPVFFHLYMKYGGHTRKPGEEMFMTLSEFSTLINAAGFVNDCFQQRDIAL